MKEAALLLGPHGLAMSMELDLLMVVKEKKTNKKTKPTTVWYLWESPIGKYQRGLLGL